MWKFFLGLAKGELIKRLREFSWSDRERASLIQAGYSEEDIRRNVDMNRIALPAWLDRQVKS